MIGVRIEIVRFIDESQPGWVDCTLIDALGRRWAFIEKVPIITAEPLDADSVYPAPGVIACEVVWRELDAAGRGFAKIDTTRPFGISSTDGESRFVVPLESLVHSGEPDA
jgi:hypothetical protein